jgi:hypothetical protein
MASLYPYSVNYVDKFAFNHELLSELKDPKYVPFIIPCIQGYVGFRKIGFKQDFILISKRDRRRPGRRFITRGLDSNGAAANFTETEHIMQFKDGNKVNFAVHTQIRGSIPLKWQMKPDLAWAPSVHIEPEFG